MPDVVVDNTLLHGISTRLSAVPDEVELGPSFADPLDAVMGSALVSTALRDAGVEQVARAQLVAESIAQLGPQPGFAADRFRFVDRQLAAQGR